VEKHHWYEIGDPDPGARPRTDRWPLHAIVVLLAGAAIGATVGAECFSRALCAGAGALCALVFVPVCLAVVKAARRAQRGRLGSIVAASDRRAVWGIIALTLAVTTLEALPEWPASTVHEAPLPVVVPFALGAAAALVLAILVADHRALAEAEAVIGAGLSAQEPAEVEPEGALLPRLDLGLGDDLLARVARGAAAYRHRERTVALVRGTPGLTLAALRRAVRRGRIGLAVLGVVAAAHLAAVTTPSLVAYERLRCGPWNMDACGLAAEHPNGE